MAGRGTRMRSAVLVAGALGLLASAAGCGSGGGNGAASSSTTGTTNSSQVAAPSQSPSDAARDGVVAAVAALPLAQRMVIGASIEAAEGVWVTSRIPDSAVPPGQGCRIGPEEGNTPTDWICTSEYGEVLLLDSGRTRILRAYPLAAVPPAFLRLAADAVYCARPGDGGLLPDSMACRIDRATLAPTVRIFPGHPDSVVVQPCFSPPTSWVLDARFLAVSELAVDSGGVRVGNGDGTWTTLDPRTLEPGSRLSAGG